MKNKKVLILSIVVVVLVLVFGLGYLYFATDLFKTDQQLFYTYLSKMKLMDNNVVQNYKAVNQKIKQNSYSSTGNMQFLALNQNNVAEDSNNQQEMFSLKTNRLENRISDQSYADFTFASNGQNILTLKYLRDANVYAIGADNILAKYVAVENANLKELFKNLGVEDVSTIPDFIPNNNEGLFNVDQATSTTLIKTYCQILYDNIQSTNYSKVNNQDGTQTISLSLSEQEIAKLARIILENAKNDTVLQNLIISKAPLFGYNELTNESIQTEIQNVLDKMANTTYATVNPDFLKISLIKKDKELIGFQLEMKAEEQPINSNTETNTNIIENTMPTETDTSVVENTLNTTTDTNQSMQNVETSQDAETSSKQAGFKLDFSQANKITLYFSENGIEEFAIVFNYSYVENAMNFNIQFQSKPAQQDGTETYYTPILELQYQLSGYQTDTIKQNYIFKAMNQNGEPQMNYQLNFENNITFTQDIQIEKLTTENSAKLNDMKPEEIQQFIEALNNRIVSLYGNNLPQTPNQAIFGATSNVASEIERKTKSVTQ